MQQPPFLFHYQGPLTSRKALEVKQTLFRLIEDGHYNLLLDLRAVQDVDIAGINALALAQKKLRSADGMLKLTLSRNGELDRMLHITKFNLLLNLSYE